MKHLLIIGRPGVGKTTLLKRLAHAMRRQAIDGFLTEEWREHEQRVGFWLSPLDGRQVLLAHRRLEHGSRVGGYRVNLSVLDDVAVPIIQRAVACARLLLLDELGRMELCSKPFEEAVRRAFDQGPPILATAGTGHLPFVDLLKRRKDVELIPLTPVNRAAIEEELLARVGMLCAKEEAVRMLQGQADRICDMIASGDVPQIDIEIQQSALRELITRVVPEQQSLYQRVYESRFRRLWQQFRY